MRNDRVPDPAPSRAGLTVQDTSATGSRDPTAEASVECAASAPTLKTEADGGSEIVHDSANVRTNVFGVGVGENCLIPAPDVIADAGWTN